MLIDSIFRRVPIFKGKQRLARFLMINKIRNYHDICIAGKYDCKFLVPNIKENIGFEIFINGVYEQSA